MAGLGPAIHVFSRRVRQDVNAGHFSHDDRRAQ
jgi:hypothetical protein